MLVRVKYWILIHINTAFGILQVIQDIFRFGKIVVEKLIVGSKRRGKSLQAKRL